VQGVLLAVVQPDNTPHGFNLTFAFPMLMFIIIAGALYVRFRSPHRVPGHIERKAATQATPTTPVTSTTPTTQVTPSTPTTPSATAESAEGEA
jgi:hypothetical protein